MLFNRNLSFNKSFVLKHSRHFGTEEQLIRSNIWCQLKVLSVWAWYKAHVDWPTTKTLQQISVKNGSWSERLIPPPLDAPAYLHAGVSASPAYRRSGSVPARSWSTALALGHGKPAARTYAPAVSTQGKQGHRRINVRGEWGCEGFFFFLPSSPTWDPQPSLARPGPTQI